MKIGDYVRTKNGYIDKIVDFKPITKYTKYNTLHFEKSFGEHLYYDEELKEIKSSPNIIDLIEEHDILKIEEQKGVYTICEVEAFREPYENYDFLGVRIDNRPIARKLYELNIKSIVTKEQFEAMEYKVGVDKE